MSISTKSLTQMVYLKSKYEPDFMVRVQGIDSWIKPKGDSEFQAVKGTHIVTDFLIENFEATREEYENFSKKSSPKQFPSRPTRMEKACKEHGIPYKNTTNEHLGETMIIFKGKESK